MDKETKDYIQKLIEQKTEELKDYVDSKIESAIENISERDIDTEISELIDSVLQNDEDACSKLNYFSQGHYIEPVDYTFKQDDTIWTCDCFVGKKQMGTGTGQTKKEAKEAAAQQCIKELSVTKKIKY